MTVLDVMIQTKGLTRYAAGNSAQSCAVPKARTKSSDRRLDYLLKNGEISQNVDMQAGDNSHHPINLVLGDPQ